MADYITKDEAERLAQRMMEENMKRISELVDARMIEAQEVSRTRDTVPFQEFRRNYSVYNSTSVPVLPRGTTIIIDTRAALNATGTVAKYLSLGDRYVEEWAKTVNP